MWYTWDNDASTVLTNVVKYLPWWIAWEEFFYNCHDQFVKDGSAMMFYDGLPSAVNNNSFNYLIEIFI